MSTDDRSPPPDTNDLAAILKFAWKFNAYEIFGSAEAAREVDALTSETYRRKGKWEGTLDELRCALFMWQRTIANTGGGLNADETEEIIALYKAIRDKWASLQDGRDTS